MDKYSVNLLPTLHVHSLAMRFVQKMKKIKTYKLCHLHKLTDSTSSGNEDAWINFMVNILSVGSSTL